MRLLVVESPNKVKKLQGYADALYGAGAIRVVATAGHWRGLPAMAGQPFSDVVDLRTWRERFVVHKDDVASRLGAALKAASEVLLASDPDREGEAIAWHIVDEFALRGARRVLFTEITQTALKKAIENAGAIDLRLVDAQRARQVLDYELGMEVSRRLWRFGCKSAGRVQSAALRIVVDREAAIEAFRSTDFWTVHASYKEGFSAAIAAFESISDEELDDSGTSRDESVRLRPTRIGDKAVAATHAADARASRHVVTAVEKKPSKRRPRPPFTTSSLQAEASSVLGFDAEKTAKVAQALFEAGLVTYIRTDSVALSDEAIDDVRGYLARHHPQILPAAPQRFADKAGAQGAHEAIRPTHMQSDEAERLTGDERALYALIWHRTLQCQAASADVETTTVTIAAGPVTFLARGVVVRSAGFLDLSRSSATADGSAPAGAGDDENEVRLPPNLAVGQTLTVAGIDVRGGKTKPPPRFTVASLIRYLERKGIGRPSTYASILSTLLDREYVKKAKKHLVPAEAGLLADRLTRVSFDALTQEQFTAVTEAALDRIASGKTDRATFLASFHTELTRLLAAAEPRLADYAARHPELDRDAASPHDVACRACGSSMLRRRGKFGAYAQCTSENCGQRVSLEPLKTLKDPCPDCEGEVVEQPFMKDGRRARFYRCTTCPWKSSSPPPKLTSWPCHADASHGAMVEVTYEKEGKKRSFFLCRVCEQKTWTGPKPPPCPLCHAPGMRLLDGPRGPFWGCAKFRDTGCKGVSAVESLEPKRPAKRGRSRRTS
jgi:DNA topoisomerase-1